MSIFYTEVEGGPLLPWPEDVEEPELLIGAEGEMFILGLSRAHVDFHSLHWTFRWDNINGFTEGINLSLSDKDSSPPKEKKLPYATTVDFPARIK